MNNSAMKMLFHQLVGKRAMKLVDAGSFVIILGDFNISHTGLDCAEGSEAVSCSHSLQLSLAIHATFAKC